MSRTVRILTTHTGSLPRPEPLLEAMRARREGHRDERMLEARLRTAVEESVRRQVANGVDLVSDGEMSKPGYSTYVTERLSGFGGRGKLPAPADLAEFPSFAARVMSDPGIAGLDTPACIGPIAYVDRRALDRDLETLRETLRHVKVEGAFVTAASPGVIALFLENRHYATHEAYVEALADAMRAEYEAIHAAGFLLQIDAPDLLMSRHMDLAGATLDDVRRRVALHVEAIGAATSNIPPERMRMHVCWGNYEGPHHRDVPLRDVLDLLLRARPAGLSFAAANPRHAHEWSVWHEVRIPEDKILIPGVIDTTTNFLEHPGLVAERIGRYVELVGVDRVQAGTDCGFGTFAGLARVDPTIAWSKLETLALGARLAEEHVSHENAFLYSGAAQ